MIGARSRRRYSSDAVRRGRGADLGATTARRARRAASGCSNTAIARGRARRRRETWSRRPRGRGMQPRYRRRCHRCASPGARAHPPVPGRRRSNRRRGRRRRHPTLDVDDPVLRARCSATTGRGRRWVRPLRLASRPSRSTLESSSTTSSTFVDVEVERHGNDHERATCAESSDASLRRSGSAGARPLELSRAVALAAGAATSELLAPCYRFRSSRESPANAGGADAT